VMRRTWLAFGWWHPQGRARTGGTIEKRGPARQRSGEGATPLNLLPPRHGARVIRGAKVTCPAAAVEGCSPESARRCLR